MLLVATRPRWSCRPRRFLAGSSRRSPFPRSTPCSARSLSRPFPEGTSAAVFGLGCFWGPSVILADRRRLHDSSRLRGRLYSKLDLRGGLEADEPGTPRPCSSSSIRRRSPTGTCSPCSGRHMTRRRGCVRARHRHAVPLGDLLLRRRAAPGR